MKGNIYTEQKCWVCGGNLIHSDRKGGLFCKDHPKVQATARFYVKFGRDVKRRFRTYDQAIRFLTGLRFKVDEKDFDPRDYQADNPMAFSKLVEEYLQERRGKLKSFRKIEHHLDTACHRWGERNVKSIKKRNINKWLKSLNVSDKTQSNYLSSLRTFFVWLVDEEIIRKNQMPDFPKIDFDLEWRNVTDWETQEKIMEEVHRLTWRHNPKIWLGIDLLRTYTNLRPGDLLKLTESDIDIETGVIMIWRPTKRKNERKSVRLVPEHIEQLKEMKTRYPALPHILFFRHHESKKGVAVGTPFGEKYFYKWWIKACENLGVKGLDLYGGTRHTTTTELAKRHGEDAAREASEHKTNKAFDRYCQMQGERAYRMAMIVREGRGKVVEMKKVDRTTSGPPIEGHAKR